MLQPLLAEEDAIPWCFFSKQLVVTLRMWKMSDWLPLLPAALASPIETTVALKTPRLSFLLNGSKVKCPHTHFNPLPDTCYLAVFPPFHFPAVADLDNLTQSALNRAPLLLFTSPPPRPYLLLLSVGTNLMCSFNSLTDEVGLWIFSLAWCTMAAKNECSPDLSVFAGQFDPWRWPIIFLIAIHCTLCKAYANRNVLGHNTDSLLKREAPLFVFRSLLELSGEANRWHLAEWEEEKETKRKEWDRKERQVKKDISYSDSTEALQQRCTLAENDLQMVGRKRKLRFRRTDAVGIILHVMP